MEEVREQLARVGAACEAIGRDPADLRRSAVLIACAGRTEAELAARAAVLGDTPGELRARGLAGTPAEIVDKARTYADAGVERLYLQILDLDDLDHLELFATGVMPQLG